MIRIHFLRPIDQFDGTHRFLQELQSCLEADCYNLLQFSVAFAKSGPLLRLSPQLKEWKQKGKKVEAIFGIDLLGTSKQALQFALQTFDKVYIIHSGTHATFHVKFYLFSGATQAVCFQGSHNLTVGGTETNLEGGVKVEFDRPEDEPLFQDALSGWTSLLPDVCSMTQVLNESLLEALLADSLIFDENKAKPKKLKEDRSSPDDSSVALAQPKRTQGMFPKSYPKLQSPIPKESFLGVPASQLQLPTQQLTATSAATVSSEVLVIQIVPHANGEVFLSKTALNQNPGFFGYPFTGEAKPKTTGNRPYPQRYPDPIVNITIYNAAGNVVLTKIGYGLNIVFYSTKAEIRITFSPDLIRLIDDYSIMVMCRTDDAHDYDIDIFNPVTSPSQRYTQYLDACNQRMPSGGKEQARKWGWL